MICETNFKFKEKKKERIFRYVKCCKENNYKRILKPKTKAIVHLLDSHLLDE